jgi:hypothetical protein
MRKYATCILKTDHPLYKDWSYSVQFISVPFVVAEPTDLNLGSFTVDGRGLSDTQKATLDLYADSKIELTRDSFTVPDELELTISPSRPEALQVQRNVWRVRYKVSVGLSPKGREAVLQVSKPGLITKAIQLETDEPTPRRWNYSVYWRTSASLESHPSTLAFGNIMDETDDHGGRVTISSTTNQRDIALKRICVSAEGVEPPPESSQFPL